MTQPFKGNRKHNRQLESSATVSLGHLFEHIHSVEFRDEVFKLVLTYALQRLMKATF